MTHTHASTLSTLLDRSARGDSDAFGEFYDLTIDDAFLLATLYGHHLTDAVVEDVYSRVWREGGTFRSSGLSPRAWVLSFTTSSARTVRASQPGAAPQAGDAATPVV